MNDSFMKEQQRTRKDEPKEKFMVLAMNFVLHIMAIIICIVVAMVLAWNKQYTGAFMSVMVGVIFGMYARDFYKK